MSFGSVGGNRRRGGYGVPASGGEDASVEAASVLFNVDGKKLKLLKDSIKKVSKKYAKIAQKMGQTNDEDSFSEQMTEDIFDALQDASKKQSYL